ncbi:hypothetical protein [Streptomyces sp. S.PB5]|uniref:hypothetical protein n=1 Tax=Streptomyces sp. S.PB5 TaxID=3020844 RepID=UPI0025B1F596|nr:hypothetical protein [Streptomyces sp. S.PB5]MDN3021050.1 hypothetical protein [Streptomyces sp. S.PB5]
MAGSQGSWTGGALSAGSLWRPKYAARAMFHPAWIPESVDPAVEQLKKARLIAGTVAAVGVYTFVEGGFAFDEMLENMLTASVVLLFITPLTVGIMLGVWGRSGSVSALKPSLFNSLKLLLLFVGTIVLTVVLLQSAGGAGFFILVLGPIVLWLIGFVARGAWHVGANFFGTAGVHRCLPPLLATVTTWLMALPDLFTGDLHGLGLGLGILFILGAPITVTGIAWLELRRLEQRYGLRLAAHPATQPRFAPAPPPMPPNAPPMPPGAPPYLPPQGNPYGNPYGPGPGQPYNPGSPYGPSAGNPYNQGNPYGSGPYAG